MPGFDNCTRVAFVIFPIPAAQVGVVRDSGAFRSAAAARLHFASAPGITSWCFPFVLALPAGCEATVVVMALQSLVELFVISLYVWWIPRYLFRA